MIRAEDWVVFHAERTPEKTVFFDQYLNRKFSYANLHQRVDWLTGYLKQEWNVQPGQVIAILAKNCVEYYEFQFSCMRLGAVMLPLNWRLATPELLYILNDSSAVGIVYDTEFTETIPALLEASSVNHVLRIDLNQVPVDDHPAYDSALAQGISGAPLDPTATHDTVVTIMYTAGTTGHPKGVLLTHGMTFWNAINISVPTGINQHSVHYVILPTFHTAGLNLYANPVIHYGGTNIIAREFDAELTLKTLADDALGVTHFFGVPAIYLFLSQHPKFDEVDLSRIQSWGCGGAPCPVTMLERYAKKDIIIQLGFGMTETSPTVFLIDKKRALKKPKSVGKPLLHTRVRVVDNNCNDVRVGEVGEVIIAGPNITPGYHNRPDANAENFTFDEQGNRWLHSGDAGMVDDEGCIYIVDRYKDMYVSGGENVYPAEVEQVLYRIEGVADAAVIGIPDEKWGEVGMAILVLQEGYSLNEEQCTMLCTDNLAKFKVPRHFATINELPRNAAGKVLKRVLRSQFIGEKS